MRLRAFVVGTLLLAIAAAACSDDDATTTTAIGSDVPALGTREDSSEETTIAYCLGIYDKAYTDAVDEMALNGTDVDEHELHAVYEDCAARTSQPAGDIREAHCKGLGERDCEGLFGPSSRDAHAVTGARIETVEREASTRCSRRSSIAIGDCMLMQDGA